MSNPIQVCKYFSQKFGTKKKCFISYIFYYFNIFSNKYILKSNYKHNSYYDHDMLQCLKVYRKYQSRGRGWKRIKSETIYDDSWRVSWTQCKNLYDSSQSINTKSTRTHDDRVCCPRVRQKVCFPYWKLLKKS